MKEYNVKIKLLSETMPGSGMAVPGVIDNDVRHDGYGLPYMNAKTFKGYVRENMEYLKKIAPSDYSNVDINKLLGSDDKDSEKKLGILKFSKVELSAGVRGRIKNAIDRKELTANEVINSLSVIYTRTRITEDGIVEPHNLRTEREIRRGIVFETKIYVEALSNDELKILCDSVKMIKHIGMHKSKGKGVVSCTINC